MKGRHMIKIQTLYKNIQNPDEFESYFTDVIIPKTLDMPGVIKMDYTSLYHSSNQQPEGLENIHVIIETYFESMEKMRETLASDVGIELVNMISSLIEDGMEVAGFIAQEKEVYAPIKVEKNTEMVRIISDGSENPQ
jgi:hypothetical protein